jgi:uncharacterized protein
MIFKRKIYQDFLAWKNTAGDKKALMVEGARRTGKSTVVEEFAKNEYKSYLLIDFSKVENSIKKAFEEYKSHYDDLFSFLSLQFNVKLYPHESLVIFDEVQRFPVAREMIKGLVQDGRYNYIETGSLISIKENVEGILIPSEERKIKMFPMDFGEFCSALSEDMLLDYIQDCFTKDVPLEESFHRRAMLLIRQYMLVGGMPQSVAAYVNGHKDFEAADAEKRDILELYRDDILKIGKRYKTKVLAIFDQLPGFLSKHEKRVILSSISAGSTIDQYDNTFFWLGNSMICNECFSVNDPNVGLSLHEDTALVKCYMGDTGLLVSHAFDENSPAGSELYKQIMGGKLSLNEGMLYENMIAQMLARSGHKLYFYTHYNSEKRRNDIEIDFILTKGSKVTYKIYPVEVKSGKNYTTDSLNTFREKFKSRVGGCYIIHPKPFRKDGDIVYLPPYMTPCL